MKTISIYTEQTMTSLEIAELTGKQHKNIMQAIRNMEPAWTKTCGLKFQLTSRTIVQPNGGTREVPCYLLTKTECLYIATKFNDEARAKLVIRWEELERAHRGQALCNPLRYSQQGQSPCTLKAAPKIFKETCEIDWTQPAKRVYDFVRGLSPVPGAWTTLVAPDGKETVLKIYKARKMDGEGFSLQECGVANMVNGERALMVKDKRLMAACGDAWLELVELQLAGKKRMSARDFLNGMKALETYRVK